MPILFSTFTNLSEGILSWVHSFCDSRLVYPLVCECVIFYPYSSHCFKMDSAIECWDEVIPRQHSLRHVIVIRKFNNTTTRLRLGLFSWKQNPNLAFTLTGDTLNWLINFCTVKSNINRTILRSKIQVSLQSFYFSKKINNSYIHKTFSRSLDLLDFHRTHIWRIILNLS